MRRYRRRYKKHSKSDNSGCYVIPVLGGAFLGLLAIYYIGLFLINNPLLFFTICCFLCVSAISYHKITNKNKTDDVKEVIPTVCSKPHFKNEGVYLFTVSKSGHPFDKTHIYVGRSKNVYLRRKQHIENIDNVQIGGQFFHKFCRQNGLKSTDLKFQKIDNDQNKEEYWINYYKTRIYGCNVK